MLRTLIVTTSLSKEEDDDTNNEDNISDVWEGSNSILQDVVELIQEEEGNILNEIENDNPNE